MPFFILFEDRQITVETHGPMKSVSELIAYCKQDAYLGLLDLEGRVTLHDHPESDPLDAAMPLDQIVEIFGNGCQLLLKTSPRHIPHPQTPPVHLERLERWNRLNQIFDSNSKSGRETLKDILEPQEFEQDQVDVPEQAIQDLLGMYEQIFKNYRGSFTRWQDNRIDRAFLIAPVLRASTTTFPELQVSVDTRLEGNRLNKCVHLDMLLTLGVKRVLVMFKSMDLTSALVGCEILADVHSQSTVFAIVTDLQEWLFCKSQNNNILVDRQQMAVTEEMDHDQLRMIVRKIHGIFRERLHD
ncbi:hypothetical protein EDD86DRAFT_104518 [Gorgonomyces haynaldii]|nr:hypothetical protein EDD86DRAFT_104518 [Gorgonomyces haynaldii]